MKKQSTGAYALNVGTEGATNATTSYNIGLVKYSSGNIGASNGDSPGSQSFFPVGYGLYNSFQHSTNSGTFGTYHPEVARYGTEVVVIDSATYGAKLYFTSRQNNTLVRGLEVYGPEVTLPGYTGSITGTHATSASFNSTGKLIQVPEKWNTISTSTDGSGDIVVAHGMGTTPTSVQVTVNGTTPYVVTVHTIDATNFTVRFYDMTGAAVTSTAVTATWHAKT